MEPKFMRIYPTGEASSGARRTRLNQLLEQEGQPCSYCIAVFLMVEKGEALSRNDNLAYRYHLAVDHGIRPYSVER